jgi:hypothetical protein
MNRKFSFVCAAAAAAVVLLGACATSGAAAGAVGGTVAAANAPMDNISIPRNTSGVTQAALYVYESASADSEENFIDFLNSFRERYVISAMQHSLDDGEKTPSVADHPEIMEAVAEIKASALQYNITLKNIVLMYRSTAGEVTLFSLPVD